MRDYGKIAPSFWTGETGRQIRAAGFQTQVVALYLLTCPSANMIGLYYMPLPTLCHETGSPSEGASKALRSLSEVGFSHYDAPSEVIWIPEMARFQIGETLSPKDKRIVAIVKTAESFRKCRFFQDFYNRYQIPFNLPKPCPFDAPSMPLRCQEQEQEQKQEQEQEILRGKPAARTERPRDELFDAIAEVSHFDPSLKSNASGIGKVAAALRKAIPPYTPADVRALPAVIEAGGLSITLTPSAIEKYIGWVRNPPKPTIGQKPIPNYQRKETVEDVLRAAREKEKLRENGL